MNDQLSNELTQELTNVGRRVDYLDPPDLKTLALAFQAERERRGKRAAELQRQMHEIRMEAIARFTQLMLCARQDIPLRTPNYFESVAQLRKLSHE